MAEKHTEGSCRSKEEEQRSRTPTDRYQASSQRNLILTGIVQNIQCTLTQLIDSKQQLASIQKQQCSPQIEILMNIKTDMATIKDIVNQNITEMSFILYSLNETCQKEVQNERTNNTKSPSSSQNQQKNSKEMNIGGFGTESLSQKLRKSDDFQADKENMFLLNNIEAAYFDSHQYKTNKCLSKEDIKKRSILKEITPFMLITENNKNMSPKCEELEDQQLDFAFYEDEEEIYREEQARNGQQWEQKQLFSMFEVPLQPLEVVGKKNNQNANITFYPNQNTIQDEATKKQRFSSDRNLFYYINHHPVLPQRLPRKKYSYLQKVKQK